MWISATSFSISCRKAWLSETWHWGMVENITHFQMVMTWGWLGRLWIYQMWTGLIWMIHVTFVGIFCHLLWTLILIVTDWMGQRNPTNHQKDGWNPNKIMGCLPPINWCRISQPSTVCPGRLPQSSSEPNFDVPWKFAGNRGTFPLKPSWVDTRC